jgi:hypothetical protein
MSTLNPLFEGLAKSVRHHAARYRLEQPRLAPLAPYPDVATLAKALAPDSPLDKEIRATIVLALVELQGAAPHPLWSSLLALAFAPMLRRLRKRIGRPRDEDLDQKVLMEFIDATTRVPRTTRSWHVAICLRRETEHRVFDHVRRDLETPTLEEFDDDHDVVWTMGEMLDRHGADRLDAALDEIPNPETRALVVATALLEEPLGEYVERMFPDLSFTEQLATAERLRRERSNAIAQLAARKRPKRKRVEDEEVA